MGGWKCLGTLGVFWWMSKKIEVEYGGWKCLGTLGVFWWMSKKIEG